MQDVARRQLLAEVGIDHLEQVSGFLFADAHLGRVALVFAVGGADQAEALQPGNDEDNALVLVLQDIGLLLVMQARHHDMAALDQADAIGRLLLEVVLQELRDPGSGGIDQGAGAGGEQAAVGAFQVQVPQTLAAPCADAAGAGVDVRVTFARGHGVEQYQAGIVHPAVGVFETAQHLRPQRAAGAKAHAVRARQFLALAQVVVEEQPGADHPGRTQVRAVGRMKRIGLTMCGALASSTSRSARASRTRRNS